MENRLAVEKALQQLLHVGIGGQGRGDLRQDIQGRQLVQALFLVRRGRFGVLGHGTREMGEPVINSTTISHFSFSPGPGKARPGIGQSLAPTSIRHRFHYGSPNDMSYALPSSSGLRLTQWRPG